MKRRRINAFVIVLTLLALSFSSLGIGLVGAAGLPPDSTADVVYGQSGSFTSSTCNDDGVSANSLCYTYGVAVDSSGNL